MSDLQKFKDQLATQLYGTTPAQSPGTCIDCKQPFSDKNTHTPAGWRETKISGLCEDCFDKIFDC